MHIPSGTEMRISLRRTAARCIQAGRGLHLVGFDDRPVISIRGRSLGSVTTNVVEEEYRDRCWKTVVMVRQLERERSNYSTTLVHHGTGEAYVLIWGGGQFRWAKPHRLDVAQLTNWVRPRG